QGQIVYEEPRLFVENHAQVNQAIIKFRAWRKQFESQTTTVHARDIPRQYTDLIALLAHESGEDLDTLAHRVNQFLSPFEKKEEVYHAFSNAIRDIINVTAHQERYGLADIVLLVEGAPKTMPPRLTLSRWQAYDTTKFPIEVTQAATKRREKRKQFSRKFTDAFQSLPKEARLQLLFDEQVNFSYSKQALEEKKRLFGSFQQEKHVHIAPYFRQPRKRLCSSFDTLLYVGLNNSFDLRQRFLNELSPTSKKPRGIPANLHLDMKKAWLESTTAGRGSPSNNMYKKIRSLKMKLIQFHEDVRPAYYGTWSKAYNGKNDINGRRPFAKDTKVLNYDYDSEAEWDHDVDGDDIHTLDPDEDDDMLITDSTDEEGEEEEEVVNDGEVKWVVPEGYLSEDEGMHDVKRYSSRARPRIVSRPAKWPISGNKHFPMKSVILGPSFESIYEPDNHPLSDFKMHMLVTLDASRGYSPLDTMVDSEASSNSETPEPVSAPLTICFEPNKIKPPLFQREIDKIMNSNKEELINIILDNKTRTMMGLVSVLKCHKLFSEHTTAQLQAMIHDIAVQEMRGTNREYNWYLRVASLAMPME
ncbi:hypothetical protein INT47_012945, partial [Mucor saturninus]